MYSLLWMVITILSVSVAGNWKESQDWLHSAWSTATVHKLVGSIAILQFPGEKNDSLSGKESQRHIPTEDRRGLRRRIVDLQSGKSCCSPRPVFWFTDHSLVWTLTLWGSHCRCRPQTFSNCVRSYLSFLVFSSTFWSPTEAPSFLIRGISSFWINDVRPIVRRPFPSRAFFSIDPGNYVVLWWCEMLRDRGKIDSWDSDEQMDKIPLKMCTPWQKVRCSRLIQELSLRKPEEMT
jgi:hypothetical protein